LLGITFYFVLLFCSNAQPIGLDLLGGKKEIEIPFNLRQGLMIVDVKLNNILPLKFIFDTGAENTILFHREYSDIMGFEYSSRVRVIGADLQEELYALITRKIKLGIPMVTTVTRDLLILEKDVYLLQEKLGFEVDGLLGGSFFKSMVVNIDFKKKIIKITHPKRFRPKSDFVEFDIKIRNNKPYLDGNVSVEEGRKVKAKLLLDTGASIPFLLHSNTDSLLKMPDFVLNGNIGHGMGGALQGFIGKIHSLDLGSLHFENLITSFQDVQDSTVIIDKKNIIRNGLIGNDLLSRFEVSIDYLMGKLYLKPNKNYNKEFQFDKSGLTIYAFGHNLKQFIVKQVVPNSPADRAGVKEGDLITRLCKKTAKRWNLERMIKLFQRKIGTEINMVVKRGDTEIPIDFILEDLFKKPRNLGL